MEAFEDGGGTKKGARRALLATAVDGLITADGAVEAARDPTSILHREFEWDDTVAGHAYRLQQARALIRTWYPEVEYIKVEDAAPIEHGIIYLHDPRISAHAQGYVSSVDLADDDDCFVGGGSIGA